MYRVTLRIEEIPQPGLALRRGPVVILDLTSDRIDLISALDTGERVIQAEKAYQESLPQLEPHRRPVLSTTGEEED